MNAPRILCRSIAVALCLQFPAWGSPVNNVEVAPGARVDVVFYTADDCEWCAKWKAHGRSDLLKRAETARFQYHEVVKKRIAEPYKKAHFDDSSGFAWKQLQAEQRYKFVIPRWVVFADGKKVVEGAGLYDWGRVDRFLGDVLAARDSK